MEKKIGIWYNVSSSTNRMQTAQTHTGCGYQTHELARYDNCQKAWVDLYVEQNQTNKILIKHEMWQIDKNVCMFGLKVHIYSSSDQWWKKY